jgi:hypothetical protein
MRVGDFPSKKIEVACPCGRRGIYAKERFDQDLQLPDLLALVTTDCPHAEPLNMLDRCRVIFPILTVSDRK